MSALILPRRFEQQPQEAVALNPDFPRPSIASLFSEPGRSIGKQFSGYPLANASTYPPGQSGRALKFSSGGYYVVTTDGDKLLSTDGNSQLVVMRRTGSAVASTAFGFGGYGIDTYRFQAHLPYSDGNIYFDHGGTSGSNRLIASGVAFSGLCVFVFTAGDPGSRIWMNGELLASNSAAATRGNPTGCFFGYGIENDTGESPTTSADTGAEYYAMATWPTRLSDEQAHALSENPWQLFRRPPLRLFFGGAASGLDLSIQSATHAHAADSLTLSATFALSVADAAHAHSADSAAVTAGYALAVNDASHAHAADNVDVVSGAAIVVADSSHAHTAESPTPSIGAGLAVADASHAHAADSAAVTAAYALAVSDSSHAHAADNVVVDTGGSLTIQSATHAHTAEQITLTAALGLAIDSATHGHVSETLTLGAVMALVIDSADHGHTAENLTLDTAITLAIADALHGHLSDGMTLTIGATLAIADALHAHAADGLTLSASLALAVNDALHGHSADNLTMTVSGAGVSLSAEDIAAIAEAVWSHPKALTFQRFIATKDL